MAKREQRPRRQISQRLSSFKPNILRKSIFILRCRSQEHISAEARADPCESSSKDKASWIRPWTASGKRSVAEDKSKLRNDESFDSLRKGATWSKVPSHGMRRKIFIHQPVVSRTQQCLLHSVRDREDPNLTCSFFLEGLPSRWKVEHLTIVTKTASCDEHTQNNFLWASHETTYQQDNISNQGHPLLCVTIKETTLLEDPPHYLPGDRSNSQKSWKKGYLLTWLQSKKQQFLIG